MTSGERRILRALLVLNATCMAIIGVLAVALLRERGREVQLADLSPADRQRAVDQELAHVGRVFVPAQIDPRMSFTLVPDAELEAWGGHFATNELGFRAPAVAKAEGRFRVVFVGDSWVFGLGESYDDSFPGQFERIARERAGDAGIESWPLALPGYNVLNEAAALEVLAPALRPDLVLWCPTNNDVSSAASADPRGFLARREREVGEPFGDGMFRDYSFRFPGSLRYLDRWRQAASEYRRASAWLAEHRVPVVMLFVARWQAGWPEWIVRESGHRGYWAVAPERWNDREYRNAESHGTPEVNRLYALAAYRLAAASLPQWPAPAPESVEAEGIPAPRRGSEPGAVASDPPLDLRRAAALPLEYRPEAWAARGGGPDPCSRTLDCGSGRMGRRAAVLLRRAPGARRLVVSIERVDPVPWALYPLTVEIRIPSSPSPSEAAVEVPAAGPSGNVVTLALPEELAEGEAFEVELVAERAAFDLEHRQLVSVVISAMEQRP